METIFSHIVQRRFSQQYEDIATDALAYLLESSADCRRGIMKVLRSVDPSLPDLIFRTQQTDGKSRPDMWGFDGREARVLIENKFWAGLTENQPVTYLENLAKCSKPRVLLFVVPTAREHTVWRELLDRLREREVEVFQHSTSAVIPHSVETSLGPKLALTTWPILLSTIRIEAVDSKAALADLDQLCALCDAADDGAFVPILPEVITDQRIPALIGQLNAIVDQCFQKLLAEDTVSNRGLRQSASSTRTGRYLWLPAERGVETWFGVDFDLWKRRGQTPIWLAWHTTSEGARAMEVRAIAEAWATRFGAPCYMESDRFVVGIKVPTGKDLASVVSEVCDAVSVLSTELGTRLSHSV